MSHGKSSRHRLDLLGVALQAFGAVALARAMFRADVGASNAAVGLSLTALFLGALLAALSWRRDTANSPVVGDRGAAAGAAFALTVSVQALLLWPERVTGASGLLPLFVCAASSAFAGVSIASCFFANRTRCGQLTTAFVIGCAVGGALVTSPPRTAALAAAAVASAGAFTLTVARRRLGAGLMAAAALGATVFTLAAPTFEFVPMIAGTGAQGWELDSSVIGQARSIAVWFAIIGALAIPMLVIAGQPAPDRRDLARLHLMALFWGLGSSLLVWRAVPLRTSGSFELPVYYPGWLAAGAVIAGLASDAWPIGAIAVRRSFLGGAVGAACLAALVLVTPTRDSQLLGLLFLLSLSSLLISLAIPAAARAGGLLRPVNSVWLWAVGALGAAAAFQYATTFPHGRLSHLIAACAGCGSVLLALLIGLDVVISRSSLLGAARWLSGAREAQGAAEVYSRVRRPNYPTTLRVLRAITYTGYSPWWIVSLALGLAARSLAALSVMLSELARGAHSGFLDLLLGQAPQTSAERVIIPNRAPVVELSPAREWRSNEGAVALGQANRTVVTIADILTFPILSLAFLVDHAAKVTGAALRRITARRPTPVRRPLAADDLLDTETLALGTQPDIVPGATASPQDILDRSLVRLEYDPGWRRLLRAILGLLPGALASQWFAPDTPEPWDDRVYRCEVIGPRGRRFDLMGRLWQSPRRRGCVITVPTLPGNVDKSLELSIRHPDLREVLGGGSEQLQKMLLRAGFRAAVSDLLIGAMGPRRTICESPRRDLLEPHQDRQCEMRQELPGGARRCRQPMPQDRTRGSTTPSACADCDLPEIWERCSCLKLEGTVGFFDPDGGLHRRAHTVCRLTGEAVDLANCPRRDCFSPSTITRIIAVDAGRTH